MTVSTLDWKRSGDFETADGMVKITINRPGRRGGSRPTTLSRDARDSALTGEAFEELRLPGLSRRP